MFHPLKDDSSVQVSTKLLCGGIVEFTFPTQSIVAAVLGSLSGFCLLVLTIKLMRDDLKKQTTNVESQPMNTNDAANL